MRKNKGFTLIELLVVIAIIGILSSVVLASLNSARKKSRDARRVSDIKQVQLALELYLSDKNAYPILTTAGAIPSILKTDGYIPVIPSDPTSGATNGYKYISDTNGTKYCVGADLEGTSNAQNICSGTTLPAAYDYAISP